MKYVRLDRVTYVRDREINYDYGTADAMDDIMSRLASIKDDDDSTVLASYRYLGAGRIVTEDYEEIQVNLDYAGDTNAFSALDRFGRVTDQVWNDYGATAVRDEYTYTYNRVGNRMSRDNELKTDGSLDETYDYDDLYRLIDFDRGAGVTQDWDLDALGNWSTFDDGTEQTREVNEANEIEKIDGSPGDVAYDAAGNMIEVPKLDGSGEHFCLKYDAWNRLAAVYDDNGTTLIAKYEYDAAGPGGGGAGAWSIREGVISMRNSKRWRDLLLVVMAISLAVVAIAAMQFLVPGFFDDSIDFVHEKVLQ